MTRCTVPRVSVKALSLALLSFVGHAFQFQPAVPSAQVLASLHGGRSPSANRRPFLAQVLGATTTSAGDAVDDKLTAPTLPEWDPTNWTAKRLHNTPLFRSAAILLALGLAGYSRAAPLARLSSQAAATVHVLSFGTWFGSVVYTTFVGGITMYKNLPRQTFGRLQSKLFPKFFNLCGVTIVLQLLTIKKIPSLMTKKASVALGISLAMTLLNLFVLEPKATKIMFERYALEDIPGGKESDKYKKLASGFGKLHGISSLANLIALCGAAAHGFYLGSALVA